MITILGRVFSLRFQICLVICLPTSLFVLSHLHPHFQYPLTGSPSFTDYSQHNVCIIHLSVVGPQSSVITNSYHMHPHPHRISISNKFPSPQPGYLFGSFLAVPVLHLRLRDRSLVRVRVLCTIVVHFLNTFRPSFGNKRSFRFD